VFRSICCWLEWLVMVLIRGSISVESSVVIVMM